MNIDSEKSADSAKGDEAAAASPAGIEAAAISGAPADAEARPGAAFITLAIWGVLALGIACSVAINSFYWGASSVLLMLLFGAVDALKPFAYAAGGFGRFLAVGAMALSVWASSQFFVADIGGGILRLDQVQSRIDEIDAELAKLDAKSEGSAEGVETVAELAAASGLKADKVAEARARLERAKLAASGAADALEASRAASADIALRRDHPSACGPAGAPSKVGPSCRSLRAEHALAAASEARALKALQDARADQQAATESLRRAEKAAATAAASLAKAEARAEKAGDSEAKDGASADKLKAERLALVDRRDGLAIENNAMISAAAKFGISALELAERISLAASIIAEALLTILPSSFIAAYGAPKAAALKVRRIEARAGERSVAMSENAGAAGALVARISEAGGASQSGRAKTYTPKERASYVEKANRMIGKGKSITAAAEALRVNRKTLSKWINAERRAGAAA